jgi:hypothetical protein
MDLYLKERGWTWRFAPSNEMERLHSQSWRELRQLIKLHGAKALIRAIQYIETEKTQRSD